jgi:tyrosyl-tRNA synthetase
LPFDKSDLGLHYGVIMYDVETLKDAIQFNTVETLPGDDAQLTAELTKFVELANTSGEEIRHYIGFEISGLIHLGTGMAAGLKIKKLTDAGVRCSIYLANYHAWLNHKLDGKMETIEKAAREYFAPVMAECFKVLGVDMSKVDFVFASDLIKSSPRGMSYFDWELLVSKELTLNRVLKSMSIMGKEAGDGIEFASLRYPPMQCTDAFFMGTHLVHAGLDQRKVHVLMREVAGSVDDSVALKLGGERIKPIAIHHSLLLGLSKPEAGSNTAKMDASVNESNKMSKSKPDSAIWVHDSEDEIKRKLKAAYCPMPQPTQTPEEITAEQSWNPLLNWAEKLLYPCGLTLKVIRPEQHGGNKSYATYAELYSDYISGSLHPMDLKTALGVTLASWLSPLRVWAEGHAGEVEFITYARK